MINYLLLSQEEIKMDNIEEIKVADKVISIYHDDFLMNPRTEWDNLGTITHNPRSREVFGEEAMEGEKVDAIYANDHDYIALKVFAYSHFNFPLFKYSR